MRNKDSTVKTANLNLYLKHKLRQIAELHRILTKEEMVLTSGNDSKHWGSLKKHQRPAGWQSFTEKAVKLISKSLHYSDCAVDIRDWHINALDPGRLKSWKRGVDNIGGYMCDYVVEGDHFHFEIELKRLLKQINRKNKKRTIPVIGKLKDPIKLENYDSGESIAELVAAVDKAKPFYRKDWFRNSWKFGLNVASQKIAGVRVFTKDKVTEKTQSLKDWLIKLIRVILSKMKGKAQ